MKYYRHKYNGAVCSEKDFRGGAPTSSDSWERVEVTPVSPIKEIRYINLYRQNNGRMKIGNTFTTRKHADDASSSIYHPDRIACVRVVLEEGTWDD